MKIHELEIENLPKITHTKKLKDKPGICLITPITKCKTKKKNQSKTPRSLFSSSLILLIFFFLYSWFATNLTNL